LLLKRYFLLSCRCFFKEAEHVSLKNPFGALEQSVLRLLRLLLLLLLPLGLGMGQGVGRDGQGGAGQGASRRS
jgi:hypothetical protein